jgi:16S rRNA (cytosine967-C5)-methyltransferase
VSGRSGARYFRNMMPDGASRATCSHGGVTNARMAAADVLADLRGGEPLDHSFDRRVHGLEPRDRRWTQELVFGTLRRRAWLDAFLAPRMRSGLARLDADLIDVMRLGVYQLLYMYSVPSYAAIAQTVELAKHRHGLGASRLANAVLRRIDRERDQLPDVQNARVPHDPIASLALRYSHPAWLVSKWVDRWGTDGTERLLAWNNEEPPLTLRPYGVVREQLEAALERSGVEVADVPLVPDSVRVLSTVTLAELPSFHQGAFFVQDPGATLVTRYASCPPTSVVADLCAAPGGKALELSRTASLVIAADRSLSRLARMQSNIHRLGARGVVPVAMDARAPAVAPVDVVVLDVPCTGTGTFRRHPDARWRLRISDLATMAVIQQEMLESAASVVRPGGLLVYSTCSLEPEENDEQVDRFLGAHRGWGIEPPPVGTVPCEVLDDGRLRVLPQRHDVDGAFAARLRRGRS